MEPRPAGVRGGQLSLTLTLEEKDLYSLDRFHEGEFNKVPLGAVRVFGSPDETGMPRSLVITGPEKSGKSHLLKGLYQRYIAERGENPKAAIIDAAVITSEPDAVERIRGLYGYELVCIDSLDYREWTPELYEAFFNLFNEVTGKGGHIAAAMRRSPAKAIGFPDFLYTRLLSGMVVTLKRPGDDERKMILAKLAADRQVSLTPAGIKYILERAGRSVGSLVELVSGIEASMGGKGGKASLQLIRSVIHSS